MPKPKFNVRELKPGESAQWRQVLSRSPEGSAYLQPDYLNALAKAADRKTNFIGVFEDDTRLIGGVALFLCPAPLGEASSSRLMLYYNGPFLLPPKAEVLYRREQYRRRTFELLERYLRNLELQFIRFKVRDVEADYRVFLANGWKANPVYSYVVDIGDLEETWSRMDNNLRRLIRRCDDQGMQFVTKGSFDSFFAMHYETHKRKGTPLYLPREKFRRFVEDVVQSGVAKLFQVSLPTGEPIASQLVLCGDHPVTHTVAAAAYEAHQATGCNALLRWRVFQWLSSKGYTANDLTDAHNQRVAKFKSQLGARLTRGMQVELPPSPAAIAAQQSIEIKDRVVGKVNQWLGRKDPS